MPIGVRTFSLPASLSLRVALAAALLLFTAGEAQAGSLADKFLKPLRESIKQIVDKAVQQVNKTQGGKSSGSGGSSTSNSSTNSSNTSGTSTSSSGQCVKPTTTMTTFKDQYGKLHGPYPITGCSGRNNICSDGCCRWKCGGGGGGGGGGGSSTGGGGQVRELPECPEGQSPLQTDSGWECAELPLEDQADAGLARRYPDLFARTVQEFSESKQGGSDGSKVAADMNLAALPGWDKQKGKACASDAACLKGAQTAGKGDRTRNLGLLKREKHFEGDLESNGGFQLASLILPQGAGDGRGFNRMPTGLPEPTEQDKGTPERLDIEALLRSAEDLMKEGRYQEALTALLKVLALDPDNPRLNKNLAVTYNRLRRFEEGLLAAVKAHKLNPKDPVPLQEFAWAKLHLGDAAAALDGAKRAIALNPNDPWSHVLAALAYERLGDREGMLKALQEAARLDPTFRCHLARAQSGARLFDDKTSERLRAGLGDCDGAPSLYSTKASGAGQRGIASRTASLLWENKVTVAGGSLLLALLGAAFWFGPDLIGARRRTKGPQIVLPDAAPDAPAASSAAPAPLASAEDGSRVGRYELVGDPREDGLGKVWAGRDPGLGRAVTVTQVVVAGGPGGAARRAAILEEARRLAALSHEAVIPLHDVLDLPRGLFLVAAPSEGRTLEQILAGSKGMTLAGAHRILAPVCAALEHAHSRGVAHRNLSPAAILVGEDGRVRLTGFGLGPVAAGLYTAPEAEEGLATPLSDVYSLGVCLFQMVTGKLPFGEEPAHANAHRPFPKAATLAPALPPELDALILAATRPTPAARTQTPGELLVALEKLLPAVTAAS